MTRIQFESEAKPIRILLVEDHQIFTRGLIAGLQLRDDFKVVGTAVDGLQALRYIEAFAPDLLLMDLELPRIGGKELFGILKKSHPALKVIVLSVHDSIHIIRGLIQDGVDGYLTKNTDMSELETAIEQVMKGNYYYNQHIVNQVFSQKSMQKRSGLELLTDRELEVIRLITQEATTKEIASQLFISVHTVNSHRKNILRKLGLKNAAGIVGFARENQL